MLINHPTGRTDVIAGSGKQGFRDGDVSSSQFFNPCGLAMDKEGNMFVADRNNHRIRKITTNGECLLWWVSYTCH